MNKKIRKVFTRTISMLIITVMMAGSFPLTVFAGGPEEGEAQTGTEYAETVSDGQESADDQDEILSGDAGEVAEDSEGYVEENAGNDDPAVSEATHDDGNAPVTYELDSHKEASIPACGGVQAAPPSDGSTLNRLSISRNGTEFPSGNDYVMSDAEGKEFLVNYKYADIENVVLVVECLDMGADFAAVPEKNEFFNEAVLIGHGKMALRLTDAAENTDCTIGFRMKHVKLTDEQVLRIMDSDVTPTSRIAATEYTLTAGTDLADVLTQGTKGEEYVLWEGTPHFNPDATVSVTSASGYTHTYKVTVSPMSDEGGSITNYYLDNICATILTNLFNGYKNGSPRFTMPGAYGSDGSLMEILSIRFYEPTDLVRLKGITTPGAATGAKTSDLFRNDFDEDWGKWTIGERTFDPDQNAYYYELTPPARVFNSNTVGKDALLAGMTLKWTMNNTAEALEPASSYLAPNTVITFRLPGDGQTTRTAEVRGPEILTGKLDYMDMRTFFPDARLSSSGSKQDVNVGQKYTKVEFSRVANGLLDSCAVVHLPIYDKPFTQEYDFPYQIAPSKIYLESRRSKIMSSAKVPVLEGISYTTWDNDTWTDIEQSVIDSVNLKMSASGDGQASIDLPSGSQVKTIQLKWKNLEVWDRPGNDPFMWTYFDFTPNHCTDNLCSDHLAQGVQVKCRYREYYDSSYRNGVFKPVEDTATMLLPGQEKASVQVVERYLWFRLKCEACEPKKCPELIGNGKDNTLGYFNGGVNGDIGDVGFDVGKYGKTYDLIHNPEITLKFKDAANAINGGAYFRNITADQLIAFFTGEFTAMPELSGWVFTYTAENKDHEVYTNTVTIPEITDENGVRDFWLPLPEGYAFTSVKLAYNGEYKAGHVDENDTRTRVWLMKDLSVHRNDEIPFLNGRVYLVDDKIGYLQLAGSVTFDITELADENGLHCECGKHVTGKGMIYTATNTDVATVRFRNNRYTTFNMEFTKPADAIIYQGESVGDSPSEDSSVTWDSKGRAFFGGTVNLFKQYPTCYSEIFPYEDIRETVYIELTDEEFIPDFENSMLWGYKFSDKCIQSEIIVVYDQDRNPHRFLKLGFVEGFVRTMSYEQLPNSTEKGWIDKGIKEINTETSYSTKGNNVISLNGHLYRDGTITGPLRLAFKTIPGTTVGEHHPVGKIYYDFSDIAKNYNASLSTPRQLWKGYDNNITVYKLQGTNGNLVYDSLNITGDKSTQLFYQDGSSWKVNVLFHNATGVSLVPGKSSTYYDYDTHTVEFFSGEEKDLNSLITLTGPGEPTASDIYDVTSITVLPRKGKAVTYSESVVSGESQTDYEKTSDESTMDLYLRGVPSVAGNNSGVEPEFLFTTSEDPLSEGAEWVSSGRISNWRDVTGVKVTMSSMAPQTSVNIRLDLETDSKTGLETYKAFAGGNYKYRLAQNGNFIEPRLLKLNTWLYGNYEINGFVFWDIFDEDGKLTTSEEEGIDNVKVTLYDVSGNIISQNGVESSSEPRRGAGNSGDSAITRGGGVFTLYSNTNEEGQYIVISAPETDDGSEPLLTSTSSDPYMLSSEDSDFDRTENKLVLGQLDSRSGYNNVSAGFIKLPVIEATDIELFVGDTVSADAYIDEFVTNTSYNDDNILTNGTYKVEYSGIDESIATMSSSDSLTMVNTLSLSSSYSFTGVTAGKFTAEVTVTNRLGDTVSAPFTVTVRAMQLEDIVVTSSWDDDDNRDGIRPDGITVQLMKNGTAEGEPVVLSDANNSTYTWSDMPRYADNGDEINYTLSVKPIADVPGHTGYTRNVSKSDYKDDLTSSSGGYEFTVRNVHIPETVDLKVTKVWEDDNNRDGIRPGSITASLSDGTSAVLNEGNSWTFTASGRYKYENGKEIEYKWTEVNVPDGYELSVDVSGYKTTLTNKHDPETVERTVVAVWLDEDNVDGIRPVDLTVGLSDGSSVTIDANNSWGITVATLYKYEDGKLMDYTWTAPAVPDGYTFSQTVEGTITTLVYVHKPSKIAPPPAQKTGTSLPSTGENIAPEVSLAISCIMLSGAMVFIAVSRSRKKENR
ncbi:MAG: Cna B-type domain-containing protein [Saccharofermentans sp.]|nr:Cna B-type domain-containing protein [Saccharofermentans sp.]